MPSDVIRPTAFDPGPSGSSRYAIENRTGETAELTYTDRSTGEGLALSIAPGEAATLQGDPAALRWLNIPPNPARMISAAEADALDAARGPGAPAWSGLAFREERAADHHPHVETAQ